MSIRTQTPNPKITKFHFRDLFAESNRGLLLDVVVFIGNIFFMRLLTDLFMDLFRRANASDPAAQLLLGFTAVGMWVLPAAGAVLKRWHFHERLKAKGETGEDHYSALVGCLFHPIMSLSLNLVITAVILACLGQIFGKRLMDNGEAFISLTILGMILTIFQTYLIYRYFSAPQKPPRWEFLREHRSETLGDLCLFLNMALFQVAWNLLTEIPWGRPSSVIDFAGRLFFLSFVALLIYFPPRLIYLAEDINRPRTWLTMFLANSPVLFRMFFGQQS